MNILTLITTSITKISIIYIVLLNIACAENNKLQVIISDSIQDKSQPFQRKELQKIIKWPNSCEEMYRAPTAGFVFINSHKNEHIVQIVCTYGSYQGMSLFYKVNTSSSKPKISLLKLPIYGKKPATEIWGNVLSTSTAKEFNILNLYSGYGHCGSLTSYNLSTGNTRIIKLKLENNCDKKPAIRDPEKWKSVDINK